MTGFQIQGNAAERYEQFVAPIMAPFVEAVLDAANLAEGSSVLDVACGTGFVARSAAAIVGPSGYVAGIDVNPGMLAVAAQTSGIEWQQAPADAVPFDADRFDATVCQQGLPFFPNPGAAVTEMRRVTRPGGAVVATVWAPLDHSAYMTAQYEGLRAVLGEEQVASFLGAFAFADRLRPVFTDAGLSDVGVHEVVAEIALPDPPTFLAGHLLSLPWGGAAAEIEGGVERVVAAMLDRLSGDLQSDGSLHAVFAAVLARGTG